MAATPLDVECGRSRGNDARRSSATGSPESDDEAEETHAHSFLTDRPLRVAEKCCPGALRSLRALGYEQAFIIRDKTHLSLYITSIVSVLCVVLWASDVWSGKCGEGDRGPWECGLEALGVIIFFGTLRDSITMLGNYDNEHRVLLERKEQQMMSLKDEVKTALFKAKENFGKLFDMLIDRYTGKAKTHLEFVFENMRPNLARLLASEGGLSKHDETVVDRLTALIGEYLGEPKQVATVWMKKVRKLRDTMNSGDVAPHDQDPDERALDSPFPDFWDALVSQHPISELHGRSFRPSSVEQFMTMNDAGKHVFMPVKEKMEAFDHLLNDSYFKEVERPQQDATRLVGCGAEEGQAQFTCRCCLPRIFGAFCRFLCCGCCGSGLCSASSYPKRIQIGCFWIKIVSRLHERLILGLFASGIFCALLCWKASVEIIAGCGQEIGSNDFWTCAWDILRGSLVIVALLFHMPALIACLAQVRELDDISRIMEDIRKVEEIRSMVGGLDRNARKDEEQQALFKAVTDRLDIRVDLVEYFRKEVIRFRDQQPPAAELGRDLAEGIVEFLERVKRVLGPVKSWVRVHPALQGLVLEQLRRESSELQKLGFKRGPEPSCVKTFKFGYTWVQHEQHQQLAAFILDYIQRFLEREQQGSGDITYKLVVIMSSAKEEVKLTNLEKRHFPVEIYVLLEVDLGGSPASRRHSGASIVAEGDVRVSSNAWSQVAAPPVARHEPLLPASASSQRRCSQS